MKTIDFEGVEPIVAMVLRDPDLWQEPCSIFDVAEIFNKKFVKGQKKRLRVREDAFFEVYKDSFVKFMGLIIVYENYTEAERDELALEWNTRVEKYINN